MPYMNGPTERAPHQARELVARPGMPPSTDNRYRVAILIRTGRDGAGAALYRLARGRPCQWLAVVAIRQFLQRSALRAPSGGLFLLRRVSVSSILGAAPAFRCGSDRAPRPRGRPRRQSSKRPVLVPVSAHGSAALTSARLGLNGPDIPRGFGIVLPAERAHQPIPDGKMSRIIAPRIAMVLIVVRDAD
jgi:hypothetical protein